MVRAWTVRMCIRTILCVARMQLPLESWVACKVIASLEATWSYGVTKKTQHVLRCFIARELGTHLFVLVLPFVFASDTLFTRLL
jgi:hypothetical protein